MRYILLIISLFVFSCIKKQSPTEAAIPVETKKNISPDTIRREKNEEKYNYQDTFFTGINEYPAIHDSATFIKELKNNCHLWHGGRNREKINYFIKTSLYGTEQKIFIIEYDYNDGYMGHPGKTQIVFNSSGKLLTMLRMIHIGPVVIFPGKHPFLIGVESTSKGNGCHEIYRMSGDSLEQLLVYSRGNRPMTYDMHGDNTVNEPYEFPYRFADVNKDGYNDILFSGKIKIIDPPEKKMLPATFIFLYNKTNRHFIPKEDYSKKYEFLFGNTWD